MSLSAECRYDKMCEALGGDGYLVNSVPDIAKSLEKVNINRKIGEQHFQAYQKKNGPSLINVIISTDSERKAQAHPWLTRSKM